MLKQYFLSSSGNLNFFGEHMAFAAISYTTAALIGGAGVALGYYLNGQSQEAEEQRNREMEGLRLNAECLTAQTVQLMGIVSQHQEAADVEQLLIQRVEQLTGAIGQLQTVQSQLRGDAGGEKSGPAHGDPGSGRNSAGAC